MKIINFPTKELASEVAESVGSALKENKETLLLVSGGSSLEVLEHIDTNLLSEKVTLSVVDERFSMDPGVNNFSGLEKTKFFDGCLEKGCAIVGTRIHKGESLTMASMNFETQLRRWKEVNPKGVTVALLGMGADGHTSGIKPLSERIFGDLFLDPEWVASYDDGEYLRFTTTLTFLREEIDRAIVYVKGPEKKEAVENLDKDLKLHQMPAQIFKEMKDVTVYTDVLKSK